MDVSEFHIGRLHISYDSSKDTLEICLERNGNMRKVEHEEGLTVSKELGSPRALGITIEDYENNFRLLPDLSWLKGKGLPPDLLDLMLKRQSFNSRHRRI